jgi:hypothetical protein
MTTDSLTQETRVVDAETGGAKGVKLARFDLIPWSIIRELAEHFGRGARKYDDRNWERGYKWSYSFGALHRHLEAFWARDDIDHDPSLYVAGEAHTTRHIIAVVWHACVLAWFSRYGVGTDDRPHDAERDDGPDAEYLRRYHAAQERSPRAGHDSWRTQAIAEMNLREHREAT